MDDFIKEDMEEALQAIASMIYRAEKAKEKFAQGTSQHTLQTNRINALNIASALLAKELPVSPAACDASKEDLEKALAPIASLISKSEKAQKKLAQGTWQHTMLNSNLKALYIASPLLAKALREKSEGTAQPE